MNTESKENLTAQIEAILFYRGEPIKKVELAEFCTISLEMLSAQLDTLRERLTGGVTLLETDTEIQLVTAPAVHDTIERLRKEDLKKEIGKAGAETLAIILYREPVTRGEIDLIRGVNSTFILRTLLVRGLIERIPHPSDKRQFQYTITPELLAHLGVQKKHELPEYQRIADEIDRYEKEQSEHTEEHTFASET